MNGVVRDVGKLPSICIRPIQDRDVDALLDLSRHVGPGITNLPPDRKVLLEKVERSRAVLGGDAEGGAVILGLEVDGRIRGCGMVFPRVGIDWPFYNYRISYNTHRSGLDGCMVRYPVLTLTNDLEDCSEVGGLVLDPTLRGGGFGRLIARARYLFIACHRDLFRDRVIAELRGWNNEGQSPFWDAVGGRFYAMSFAEADHINAVTGNQFIADLGPRGAIYVNMLSQEAQDAIGQVHDDGRAAKAMLLKEGFREEGYVDIFDAGPTLVAAIDDLRTVRTLQRSSCAKIAFADEAGDHLVARGQGAEFLCSPASVSEAQTGVVIGGTSVPTLGTQVGDVVVYVPL